MPFIHDALQKRGGFIQEVRCTTERHLELSHRFRPSSFPLQQLKSAVLLIQNGLLGIEHEVIDGAHVCLRCMETTR